MLGPQCWSCKRRRVRCDSGKPTCARCPRDGIECPGYRKPTTWVVHDQSSKCLTRSRHRPAESSRNAGAGRAKAAHVALRHNLSPNANNLQPMQNAVWFSSDKFALEFVNSVIYHNEQIAPFSTPDAAAIQWSIIDLKEWQDEPDLIKQLFHMSCTQHKIIRCHNDLDSDMNICKQRQQAFETLNKQLSHATTQTSDLTLDAVIMFLTADLMYSSKNAWHAHVHGAATIIELRGGWKTYVALSCENHWASSFMLSVAIMGDTTSSSRLMSESPTWPFILAEDFSDWDEFAVTGWFPCPEPLFRAISRINRLRANLYQKATPVTSSPHSTSSSPRSIYTDNIQELRSILIQITTFSPSDWFSNLISTIDFELSSPDWLTLIHCYHAATLLYCLRTLVIESPLSDDEELSSLLENSFGTSVAEAIRIGAVRALFQRLGCPLASFATGSGLQPKSMAWNAVMWPLVIAGYEAGGAGLAKEEVRGMRSYVVEKMTELAVLLGTKSMIEARMLLEMCWERRSKGRGGGLDGGWTWDETFTERYCFLF